MKVHRIVFVAMMFLLFGLQIPQSIVASVLFDNGTFSGPQEGRNLSGFTIFEDFTLANAATIHSVEWSQHDLLTIPYSTTTLTFYSAFPFVAANEITSYTTGASRTPNTTPVLFGNLVGLNYSISGLALTLSAGSYWFGLTASPSVGGMTWDQTDGTASTIPGRYQSTSDDALPFKFYPAEDSAFHIISDSPQIAIPEPSTLVLLSIAIGGMLGLGFRRWQRFPAQNRQA